MSESFSQPHLPFLIAHHGNALEVRIMLDAEFLATPGGEQVPASEVFELRHQPQPALRPQGRLHHRYEQLIILIA